MYAAHRTPDVLEQFEQNELQVVFVLANCTSELQPLDLSLNGQLKERCNDSFAQWYLQDVSDHTKDKREHVGEIAAASAFQPFKLICAFQ